MKGDFMNKMFVLMTALGCLVPYVAFSQEPAKTLPLAEARAQIGDVISAPDKMRSVMTRLSAEDQVSFLADVNAAIKNMPGSVDEKTATYLNVNRAALKGASKGNTAELLAEVFATVEPAALKVINERFAADLFSRTADPSRSFSDDEFSFIAKTMMEKVVKRTAGSDDASVRNAFAAMMLVRASNGTPSGLADTLAEMIPDQSARDLAKSEWFPAAFATPAEYGSILAYANVSGEPSVPVVLKIAGPQVMDAMLADLSAGSVDPAGRTATPLLDRAVGNFGEARVNDPDPEKLIGFGEEPRPYQWQRN